MKPHKLIACPLVTVALALPGPGQAQSNSAVEASATHPGRLMDDVQTSGGTEGKPDPAPRGDKSAQRQKEGREKPGAFTDLQPLAPGEGKVSGSVGHGTPMRKADQAMLRQLAHANQAEISWARLALEKSGDAKLKGLARMLLDDHARAQKQIEHLAAGKGISLEDKLDDRQQATLQRASKLDGEHSAFLKQAGVVAHSKTLSLVTKIANHAKDTDLKSAAASLQPILKQHLYTARELAKQEDVNVSAAGSSK